MRNIRALILAALLGLPVAAGAAAPVLEAPAEVPFAAAVKQDGRWGAVDAAGRVLIPMQYDAVAVSLIDDSRRAADLAMPGRDRLIEVKQDGKYGFFDRTGAVIVPAVYEARSVWQDGALTVQRKKGELGIYRDDGRELAAPVYEAASDMKDGWAIVKQDGKYGYVSREGTVLAPVYDEARYFREGFAPVKQKQWGVIDTAGQFVVPCGYDDAGPYVSDGLLAAEKDNHWGFIDMTGRAVIPFTYREVHPVFAEHLTAVQSDDKLWGFVSSTGEVTAAPVFSNVVTPFSEGLAGVVTRDGKAYARPDGTIAFHADYDRIYAFEDGLAEYLEGEPAAIPRRSSVSIGIGIGWGGYHHHPWGWGIGWPLWGPWWYDDWYDGPTRAVEVKRGYLDKTGRLIASADLGRVYPAMEEGIIVFNRNRFGMVDRTGQYVIHTEYRALSPDAGNHCLLARDEEKNWGVLSFTGETLVPFRYDELRSLGSDCFAGKRDGGWALLRRDGTELTAPVYKEIGPGGSGLFPARTRSSWVYLDASGQEALRFSDKVQEALPFVHGGAGVRIGGKWGLIDPAGAFTVSPVYSDLRLL